MKKGSPRAAGAFEILQIVENHVSFHFLGPYYSCVNVLAVHVITNRRYSYKVNN